MRRGVADADTGVQRFHVNRDFARAAKVMRCLGRIILRADVIPCRADDGYATSVIL